jgi:hypothetical protein
MTPSKYNLGILVPMKAVKVSVIVQTTNEKEVRDALRKAGVGKIGNYKNCQFITHGEAQFEPNEEADPAIGEKEKLDVVPAIQIQTWCKEEEVEQVVKIIKDAHPNEEPAIELSPIELR